MPQYALECPSCGAREPLDAPEPEARVRCPSCRRVMIVPPLQAVEPAERELDPALKRRLVRALAVKRLAILAAGLLLVSSLGLAVFVEAQAARREAAPPAVSATASVTLESLPALNPSRALPFSRGRVWTYLLGDGSREERRVSLLSSGPEGRPEADLAVTGSRQAGLQTYRVTADATWLVSEQRADGRWTLKTPLKVVPHPLYAEDRWRMDGSAVNGRGATEVWSLECRVVKTENVEVPAGRFPCYRIDVKGLKGAVPVEETWWLAKGTGLVKRRTLTGGTVEEARLEKY